MSCHNCQRRLSEDQPIFTLDFLAKRGFQNEFCSLECSIRYSQELIDDIVKGISR